MVPPADSNPYAAPTAQVSQSYSDDERPLASLGARLGGVLIDMIVPVLLVVPMMLAMASSGALEIDENGQSTYNAEGGFPAIFMVLAALIVVFAVVQLYLLVTRSQTIGKIAMKTRIDEFDNNARARWTKTIIMRGFVVGLIGAIPIVGSIFSLVNIFFIFREDRRCLHDHIAGTVVRVAPEA